MGDDLPFRVPEVELEKVVLADDVGFDVGYSGIGGSNSNEAPVIGDKEGTVGVAALVVARGECSVAGQPGGVETKSDGVCNCGDKGLGVALL